MLMVFFNWLLRNVIAKDVFLILDLKASIVSICVGVAVVMVLVKDIGALVLPFLFA